MIVRDQTPPPPAQRPISGLERVWLAAEGIDPPFTIRLVLIPARMPSIDRWRDAWTRTLAVRPGMRLRAHGRGRRATWVADGPIPAVETIDGDWDGLTDHPCLHQPVDPWRGPSMRLLVGERAAVLLIHHAIADGRGCWRMARDLLAVLDGAEPVAAPLAPLDAEVAARLERPDYTDPPADRPPPFLTRAPAAGFVWARRQLTPRSGLLADLARRLVAHRGATLRFGVPVDLRRHLTDDAGDGNLTGVAHVDVTPAMDQAAVRAAIMAAVEERRAEAHAAAADAVRGVPLWLMRWVGKRAAARQIKTDRYPVSATLSNLGRLPLRLGGAPVTTYFLPPYNRGMPLLITLVGDDTQAQLVAVSARAFGGDGRLDALLDAITD